jgi:hypothetical protein
VKYNERGKYDGKKRIIGERIIGRVEKRKKQTKEETKKEI